jgi:very-long-chain enoyl-CoA reductase
LQSLITISITVVVLVDSKPMSKTITIKRRDGSDIGTVTINAGATIADLKKEIYKLNKRVNPERQRLTLGIDKSGVVLENDKIVGTFDFKDGVFVKDLGPQIGYKTLFILEYLGPLVVYPLFYYRPSFIYGSGADRAPTHFAQDLALLSWSFHYSKRILETIFVHRFSNDTMPIKNIFKNCGYYWGFAALVSYFVNKPQFVEPLHNHVLFGAGLFFVSEIANFITHMQLRYLRPEGTRKRGIPRGFLFDLVSCPNYFMEILAWVGFSVMTQTWPSLLFTLVGSVQMWIWAKDKHRKYKKEFDGKEGRELYPKGRKILIPYIL